MRQRSPVLILLLTLAVLVQACATGSGTKPLLITEAGLTAASTEFAALAPVFDRMVRDKAITVDQYKTWRTFGQKFQVVFPGAVALWKSARAGNDVEKERQLSVVLASLTGQLATFAAIAYEFMNTGRVVENPWPTPTMVAASGR